jgi:hypothetical protein
MNPIKKQLTAFSILLLFIISPVASVTAQRRVSKTLFFPKSDFNKETQTSTVSQIPPIVITGNPSCATLNASPDPAFAHITNNFGFKLQEPPTGDYPFTDGDIRELTGDAPSEPGSTLSITRLSPTTISWSSTRLITAVIVKAAAEANVYPYNPAAFGDANLVTADTNEISHVEVCYGPAPASITIIKDTQPNSPQAFEFTASGQINQNFSLVDNGTVGPDRIVFSNLTGSNVGNGAMSTKAPSYSLSGDNAVTITETSLAPYSHTGISCTSNGTGTENNLINVPLRFVTIKLEPGEAVVCTFVNSITTSANVSASGRVLDSSGNPISKARVTVKNTATGESRTVYTGSFGHYTFENLRSGDFYLISISHRRYTFFQSTQFFVLNDAVENMDFIADVQ